MDKKLSRRRILQSVAAGSVGFTGLTGAASAHDTDDRVNFGSGPVEDAPYTVITYQQSEFQPIELTVPVGATVEFLGNRFPHTITSTESWADVLSDCGDGGRGPYNGDAEEDKPEEGNDGKKGDDGIIRATIDDSDEPYSVFLESGGTTRITYNDPGTYTYYCVPHCGSAMIGEITVLPTSGAGAPGTQEALVDGYQVKQLAPVRIPTAINFGPDGDLYVASAPRSGYEDQIFPGGASDVVKDLVSSSGTVERVSLEYTSGGPVMTDLTTVADGLSFPLGVAFDQDGGLYVSDNRREIKNDSISRKKATLYYFDAFDGSGEKRPVVDGLPSGPIHDTNHIKTGPDGDIYLAVGSTSCNGQNYGREIFPYTGSILRVDPDEIKDDPATLYWADEDGNPIEHDAAEWDNANRQIAQHPRNDDFNRKVEVLARGFRNIFGLAFDDGVIHTGRNGVQNPETQDSFYRLDEIGRRDVPDGDDELRPKKFSDIPHYGFPYVLPYGEDGDAGRETETELQVNPKYEDVDFEFDPDNYIAPDAMMGWHVCATGLDFPTNGQTAFPDKVQEDAYIAECGAYSAQSTVENTLNAGDTRNTGRKVTRVDLDKDGNVQGYQDFLTGFSSPTDVQFGPEGAMYIADLDNGIFVAHPTV